MPRTSICTCGLPIFNDFNRGWCHYDGSVFHFKCSRCGYRGPSLNRLESCPVCGESVRLSFHHKATVAPPVRSISLPYID